MTAKEYLIQYIESKRTNTLFLYEHDDEAEVIRNLQKNLNVFPAQRRQEIEERLHKCIMFCNGIKSRAQKAACKMDEIQAMIESIPGLEGEILKLRYIDGLVWEDVAERVFFSYRGVHHRHDKALEMVEERLDSK